jgi:hypothetical protein
MVKIKDHNDGNSNLYGGSPQLLERKSVFITD